MSAGATHATATRTSHADIDQGTLLGLYHGYDQARLALARLVTQFGAEAASDEETRRRIWSRIAHEGFATDLFHPPAPSATTGLNRGAHSAALSAFAAMSEKAEELLRTIRTRWPELCEDAGGPLPSPSPGWELD